MPNEPPPAPRFRVVKPVLRLLIAGHGPVDLPAFGGIADVGAKGGRLLSALLASDTPLPDFWPSRNQISLSLKALEAAATGGRAPPPVGSPPVLDMVRTAVMARPGPLSVHQVSAICGLASFVLSGPAAARPHDPGDFEGWASLGSSLAIALGGAIPVEASN